MSETLRRHFLQVASFLPFCIVVWELIDCDDPQLGLTSLMFDVHSVEITEIFCQPDFTWTQSWPDWLKFTKFSNFRASKITKMAVLVLVLSMKLISRKKLSERKILKFPNCVVFPNFLSWRHEVNHLNCYKYNCYVLLGCAQKKRNFKIYVKSILACLELWAQTFQQNNFHYFFREIKCKMKMLQTLISP